MAFVLRLQKSVIWWYAYLRLGQPLVKILKSKETKQMVGTNDVSSPKLSAAAYVARLRGNC